MTAGLLVMVLVLLVMVLLVPAAAGTANNQWPDLLPADCGTRLVQLQDFSRLLIVGTGNTTAYYGQFPWQARIEVYKPSWRGYRHQCGGIIITQRHVITAAHCVDHVALTSMQVRVGDLRFGRKDENEQVFAVATFHVHYHFSNGTTYANDIALLRLKVRRGVGIEFSDFVQPACLPEADTEYETNTECEVSGWGKTADGAPISETLRGASVPLVSDEFCSAPEVHQSRFVPGRMFCAGLVRGGPDACGGDSGGPLVCRDPSNDRFVAYGIVSSGDPLGCGRLPGLYTKLSGFVSWLLARLQLDLGEKSDARTISIPPDTKPTIVTPHTKPTSVPSDTNLIIAPSDTKPTSTLPDTKPTHTPDTERTRTSPETESTTTATPADSGETESTTTATPADSGNTESTTTTTPADSEIVCGRSNFSPLGDVHADFARQTDFPWLVSISIGEEGQRCIGTVVSDRWILTAWYCVLKAIKLEAPFAAVPNVTTGEPVMTFDLSRYVDYRIFGNSDEFWLLKTIDRMPLSNSLRPICLPDRDMFEVKPGMTIFIASSDYVFSGNNSPGALEWSKVTVLDHNECWRIMVQEELGRFFLTFPSGSVFCGRYQKPVRGPGCEHSFDGYGDPGMVVVKENGTSRWYQLALNRGIRLTCDSNGLITDTFIDMNYHIEWIMEGISET